MQGTKLLKLLPLFILLLLITGGAAKSNYTTQPLDNFSSKGFHTIIMTNNIDDKSHSDSQYYYALLMMRDKHPSRSYDVHIFNKNDKPKLAASLNITNYPTLVVIKNNKTISMISGQHKWTHIYKELNRLVAFNAS